MTLLHFPMWNRNNRMLTKVIINSIRMRDQSVGKRIISINIMIPMF